MLRLMSLGIVLGAFWLANLAVPQTENQHRLKRVVGISLNGDPGGVSTIEVASRRIYGRLPQTVFGHDSLSDEATALDKVVASTRPAASKVIRLAPPLRRITSLMPLPDQKPVQDIVQVATAAPKIPTVADAVTKPVEEKKVAAAPKTETSSWWSTETASSSSTELVDTDKAEEDQPRITQVSAPAPDMTRQERRRVARHLQRELRRVGCYSGPADGVWGARSKDAMQAFSTKVSGNLTTDQPDYVALMLVEKLDARACGDTSIVATATIPDVRDVTIVSAALPDVPRQKPAHTTSRPTKTASAKPTRVRTALRAPDPATTKSPPRRIPPKVLASAKRAPVSKTVPARAKLTPKRVAKRRTTIANKRARLRKVRTARRLRKRRARRAQRLTRIKQRRRRARYVYVYRTPKPRYGFSQRGGRSWVRRAFAHKN